MRAGSLNPGPCTQGWSWLGRGCWAAQGPARQGLLRRVRECGGTAVVRERLAPDPYPPEALGHAQGRARHQAMLGAGGASSSRHSCGCFYFVRPCLWGMSPNALAGQSEQGRYVGCLRGVWDHVKCLPIPCMLAHPLGACPPPWPAPWCPPRVCPAATKASVHARASTQAAARCAHC